MRRFWRSLRWKEVPFDSPSKKLSEEVREVFIVNQLTDVIETPCVEIAPPVIDAMRRISSPAGHP